MNSKAMRWAGWALSVLPALMLLFSAAMKLTGGPEVMQGFEKLGWAAKLLVPLAILEIAVTLLYLFPKTAILGAILVTGYLGGAIATHVRIDDAFVVVVLLGVAIWAGLYLREPRLRSLIPLVR